MNLRFPELGGGQAQGLNDAGVENFQGSIDEYLSRECGQNSCDAVAREGETVRLEFTRIEMQASDIPGFDTLRQTLKACLHRWTDEKEKNFFEQAINEASQEKIHVLKISDFGTTGLTGGDDDERDRWYALVKSQGVSNKGGSAGGSFGIGKSSPFAASRFRTVFYGTRTLDGALALQGVSRLVTHKNPEGRLTQGTGFIGNYDAVSGRDGEPLFSAVRDLSKIPVKWRREEAGTDILVLGYVSGVEWKEDLIRSILSNFWPAIHRNKIQFQVGDQFIGSENLQEQIELRSGQEGFDAAHYFKAIQAQPLKKRLSHAGDCVLYLTTVSADLPKKICMTRDTGMRIYDYQPRACRVPFSGLFSCIDSKGNKLLRTLEPPRHDAWDPARSDQDKQGKRVLDEIKEWIRDEVKKLNPDFGGKSFNGAELAKYLPDLETDDPTEAPAHDNGLSEEEDIVPKPAMSRPAMTRVKTKTVKQSGSEDDLGGLGDDGDLTGHGDGDGTGGNGERQGGGEGEGTSIVAVNVRSFRKGEGNSYELLLRSGQNFRGTVYVLAVGEEGKPEPISLNGAQVAGRQMRVTKNAIADVEIVAGKPLRLSVELNAITRRSIAVRAMQ